MVFVWYRAKKFEMSLEDFEKGTEYIFPLVTADVIEHRGRTDFKNFGEWMPKCLESSFVFQFFSTAPEKLRTRT